MTKSFEGLRKRWTLPPVAEGVEGALDILLPQPVVGVVEDPVVPFLRPAAEALIGVKGKEVLISADYDADGVVSAVIWADLVGFLGGRARVSFPDRIRDGYGVVHGDFECVARNLGMWLTTDVGSSDLGRIGEGAERFGVRTLVFDHHIPPEGRVGASGLVSEFNPSIADGCIPSHYCAGTIAGVVSWILREMGAISAEADERNSVLAGIACIGDVANLRGSATRFFVQKLLLKGGKVGLHGLNAILAATAPNRDSLTASVIGFQVAPLINAAGRVGSAASAYDALAAKDADSAKKYTEVLLAINRKRKFVQDSVIHDASALMTSGVPLVAYEAHWPPGVVGIAAGRVAESIHAPVFLGAINTEKKEIVFSGRTSQGLNLYEIAAPILTNLNARFGGHASAMGCSFPNTEEGRTKIGIFREKLKGALPNEIPKASFPLTRFLRGGSVCFSNYEIVSKKEPFGNGFDAPFFCVLSTKLKIAPSSNSPSTWTGVAIDSEGSVFPVLAFRLPLHSVDLRKKYHLVGQLLLNDRKNEQTIKFLLEDLIPI